MTQTLTISGLINRVLSVEQGIGLSGKPWRSQVFVITTIGDYPKTIAVTLRSDNIEKYAALLRIGSGIVCDIDIESHEWQQRWYTDVTAWRIRQQDLKV
jgi:hypothetical protein